MTTAGSAHLFHPISTKPRRLAARRWRAPLLLLTALAVPAAPEANPLRSAAGAAPARASIATNSVDTCLDARMADRARGLRGVALPGAAPLDPPTAGFDELGRNDVCHARTIDPAEPAFKFAHGSVIGNVYGSVELQGLPTDWRSGDALADGAGGSLAVTTGVTRPVLGWVAGGANLTVEGSLGRVIDNVPDDVRYDQRLNVRLDRNVGSWNGGVEASFGSRSSLDLGRHTQSDSRYTGHLGFGRTTNMGTQHRAVVTVSLSNSGNRADGYETKTATAGVNYEVRSGAASVNVGINHTDGGDNLGSMWKDTRGEIHFSTRF
jgi:hypothetical protein